jgi:hypothetical protein
MQLESQFRAWRNPHSDSIRPDNALGLNRCNGRRIDDRAACKQTACTVFESCGRVPLKPT